MNYVSISFCLLFSLIFHEITAQEELTTKRWETIDIHFKSSKKSNIPFDEIVGCVFTSSSGNQLNVPGFYNGNSEWIVRFTPNEEGKWTATSYSSIKNLSGVSKEILVEENDEDNHGGLLVNPENTKHLVYESGKPYFLLAFEADWLFALDYGNAELPKTHQLLKHIKENGFNQIVMNVYAHDVRWKKDPTLKPAYEFGGKLDIYPFVGNNEKPDHTSLNVDFFKHLDRVIELLNDNGIVAHLMMYVWNKKVNWPAAYSKEDNRYFDYVVKRYQGYNNVLWDISKEALGYGHDDINYITDRIERLRKLDVYNRLVTVHDFHYCSQYPENVDIISIQSWETNLYARMLDIGKRFTDKPVFNIEHGGYEPAQYKVFLGNFDNAEICLRRNYLSAFAGAYTTYYWQGTSWNVIIYNPFSEENKIHPKFSYYKHFYDFFKKYPFETLKPVDDKSSSGFCLTNAKDTYLYYVSNENTAIDIKKLPQADQLEIVWFNTQTGQYSSSRTMPWSNYFTLIPEFTSVDTILIVKTL